METKTVVFQVDESRDLFDMSVLHSMLSECNSQRNLLNLEAYDSSGV